MRQSIPFVVLENIHHGLAIFFNKDPSIHIGDEDDIDVVNSPDGLFLTVGNATLRDLPEKVIQNILDKNQILKVFEMDEENITKSWIV